MGKRQGQWILFCGIIVTTRLFCWKNVVKIWLLRQSRRGRRKNNNPECKQRIHLITCVPDCRFPALAYVGCPVYQQSSIRKPFLNMSRITKTFERLRRENRAALVGFFSVGDPDFERSLDIISAACDAGLDVLELGIPFSDPIADGPVIQRASQRAIQSGMTLERGLEFVRRMRERVAGHTAPFHDLPIIVFSYYNPIIAMGAERFVHEAMVAGADGALVVDLPSENAGEIMQFVDQQPGSERKFHFIRLIAPTTDPERRSEILRTADGFVYCVSRRGVTGKNTADNTIDWDELTQEMTAMRSETTVPLCLGFGISTTDDVRAIAKIADGAIIGSAFQQVIEADPDTAKTKICEMIREFRDAA